ncbi:MAG: TIM barrel protein [Rubripirellula sp.]|nr:TIM barrel protein [Rubripirellula sp.]
MTQPSKTKRRNFLQASAAITGACVLANPSRLFAAADEKSGWLRKTLKIGMIRSDGTLTDKFKLAKEAGFEGVELSVPGVNADEAKEASAASGLIIDGTVGNYHWGERHTDPSETVRATALAKLKQGLRDTAALGADTMLLVPGHGKDGTDAEVYERAVAAIREAIPVAEETKVSILIENVWNDFLYDHEGGADQTADKLAAFIDDLDSAWVGVQYDIGNHWKYGDPAAWIRTLGNRIKKLDIKGFSRESGQFTKITEGDIDWATVKQALRDIKFTGWLAAEVGGGGLDRLQEVSRNLDKALQCGEKV